MANQQFERTDRIASEIMRETEKIIREDVSDPRTDCMFSITHVDVTRDLRYAKVYVSIYEEEKRAPMMKALKTAAGFIRHNLGRRVQLRYTPELVFELDTTIEYGVHIASLINQVRKTEESIGCAMPTRRSAWRCWPMFPRMGTLWVLRWRFALLFWRWVSRSM